MAENIQKVKNNNETFHKSQKNYYLLFGDLQPFFQTFYHYFLKFYSMQAIYDYRLHINNCFGP